jgi:hypothetical protein
MKKVFITTFCCSLLVFGLFSFQKTPRIIINEDLSLVIPLPNIEQEELFLAITKVNPTVIFLRSLSTSKSKPILFAVSRYENSKPVKLSSAFYEQTANHHPTNLGDISKNHKVISFREYIKGNKTLYTKVSKPFEGQCNIMYYFMKDNFSNVMYEIKLSGKLSEKEEMESIAEKIALSVEL